MKLACKEGWWKLTCPRPRSALIPPFVWGDRKEDAHANSNLLSSTSASTKFNFNGTLDLAIVAARYERCGYPSGGVFMGIEVKKNVEPRNDMQAAVELVLADIPLRSIWRYFWFQKGIIASCQFDLPGGIAFLDLLTNEFKSSTTSIPATLASASSHLPYQNQCKFRYAIEQDNDVHETTTPSEGIGEAQDRLDDDLARKRCGRHAPGFRRNDSKRSLRMEIQEGSAVSYEKTGIAVHRKGDSCTHEGVQGGGFRGKICVFIRRSYRTKELQD
ncbi:hypothetical protein EV426DRAFT_719311 [Tirmania nivea]|nr:hypothetical protein EV426DRAFT_719311 [Tirmania nivea]